MTDIEKHKVLVRRFYSEVVEQGNIHVLQEIADPDMLDHGAERNGWAPGLAGFTQHVEMLQGAVGQRYVEVDDLISEGDRVVAYWRLTGIHEGSFLGVAATGKPFTASAVSRFTIRNGKITEYMVRPDVYGFRLAVGAA